MNSTANLRMNRKRGVKSERNSEYQSGNKSDGPMCGKGSILRKHIADGSLRMSGKNAESKVKYIVDCGHDLYDWSNRAASDWKPGIGYILLSWGGRSFGTDCIFGNKVFSNQ